MKELKTSLSPTSQTFIDIKDTIRKGIDDKIFKTNEDIMSFINDNGYEVEDYKQANKEYKKLIAEGKDPKDVSIPEALGKVVVKGAVDLGSELVSKGASITPKFITDAVEKISDKAGDVIPESVKDYTQGFTDPYYGTGKSQLIGEIGEDVTQGALAILGFRKALGKPKEAIKDVKKAAKSVDNIIKKAPRLFTKDAAKKVGKDILKDSVALTLAFSPEEATLDGLSKAFPETFKPAKPFFDMLAVDPDDPKALQYLNTFGQELITAGAIDIPLAALIGIFKSGAKVFSKQKAIEDGVTAPVASKKADGEDTLANNAKNEQVNSNTVVEDADGNYIQEVNLTKPIEEGGEQTVKKEVYDVPTKKSSFKTLKEYFFSNRGLTDDAYDLYIARKGEPQYFKKQAIFNVKNFNKAIKEEYNVNSFDELSPEMSQKINRTLVLDDDIDEFVNLKQQNIQKVKPQAKKQIEAENAARVSEGKKPFNKKIINKKIKQLSEELGDNLTRSFFRNQQQKLLSSFKPKTREAIKNIRKNVDENSNYLANSGVLGQKLSIKFGKNNKFYLQRSYKVFNDPDVNKKLDEAIGIVEALQTGKTVKQKTLQKYADDISRVENFQRFLADATGITNPTELAPIAREYIKSFGDNSKTIFNLISDTPTYKTGTKGIQKRVLQSEELKKFRMEEVNPMTRYLRTMENLGEIVAQTKFLKTLKEDGLAKGYLVEGTKIKMPSKIKKQGVGEVTVPGKVGDDITDIGDEFAEEMDEALEINAYKNVDPSLKNLGPVSKDVKQIGGLEMPRGILSPLEGIFADDVFANGLTYGLARARPGEGVGGLWNAVVSGFKGFTEYLLAVISPVTQAINNIGNGGFVISFGTLNPRLLSDAKNLIKNSSALGVNKEYLKWLDKHKRLGLINTGVRAQQFKEYLKETSTAIGNKVNSPNIAKKIFFPVKKTFDIIGGVYEFSDALWRLGVFNGLRKRASRNIQPHLKEMPIANNKSLDDVVDEFVAQRVRKGMPNWYMVSKGVRQWARQVPLGSFVSWNTEVLRTVKETFKRIYRDGSGRSINDIARIAGFRDADDMLAKTGYDLKKNKSMKSLRNEALKSFGGVTALALGVDVLTGTSANSNNIKQNQVDALNEIGDFFTASGKIFVEPVKFRRRKTEKGLSSEELIYTYKEPSRLDVWQVLKSPVRRIYRALKNKENISDAEFNTMMMYAVADILEPYFSPSVLAQSLINIIEPTKAVIFPEGSGQREVDELLRRVFGRNALFSSGLSNDVINYLNAKESERAQSRLNTVVNEWEYDGTQWINKGKVDATGVRSGMSLPSKFEPGSILRDGLTKDNILSIIGLKTKEFNVTNSIKFKVAPLYLAKQKARKEFFKTVTKYQRERDYDEDRFFDDFESAIEKSYQADRKLFNLIKKYKVLGLTETQIAEAINANIEKGDIPKISGDKVTRLLVGSYDASQWLLNEKGNEKLKTAILRLPEASLGDGSSFDKKVNETWFKYKDKKF